MHFRIPSNPSHSVILSQIIFMKRQPEIISSHGTIPHEVEVFVKSAVPNKKQVLFVFLQSNLHKSIKMSKLVCPSGSDASQSRFRIFSAVFTEHICSSLDLQTVSNQALNTCRNGAALHNKCPPFLPSGGCPHHRAAGAALRACA